MIPLRVSLTDEFAVALPVRVLLGTDGQNPLALAGVGR